jgi:glucose-1-phosphate cytidylyltransferase
MKAVILAGGLGSRLSEETTLRPKPMVEIGGRPILWHIMIALGYKGAIIKEFFLNYYAFTNDISVDLATGRTTIHDGNQPNWKIHLVDTGLHTQTGGRLKRVRSWLRENETFVFTYGDGVTDLDVTKLVDFHHAHGRLATVTTVRPPSRFGRIAYDGSRVAEFYEKPESGEGWINGGYFVLNTKALDYICGDDSVWEREPVEQLARAKQLMGFQHEGFWSCMDTLKEKNMLEEMWASEKTPCPWKVWADEVVGTF